MHKDPSTSGRSLIRTPQARADCVEFFHEPDRVLLPFRGPAAVIEALEATAMQSRRTFNEQMNYALGICLGDQQPTADDPRSVTDWRAMMAQCEFLRDDGSPYTIPFDHWTEASGAA